jgi:hypothetical protein
MAVDSPQLVQTLIESFNALADEVQNLVDRKIILEHKLRWSHEQVSGYYSFCCSLCVLFFSSKCIGPSST